MNENIVNIKYNPELMIDEVKNLQALIVNEDDDMTGIYKFELYRKKNGLSIRALVNESLVETLSPLRSLIENISEEIIRMYNLYSLNLELNKEPSIELFSLNLSIKEEKRFKLLIILNLDYINFFNEDEFKENDVLDRYVIKFNELFNKIVLDVYDLSDKLNIPIIKIVKKTEEYELIFIRNEEDNLWTYHTFIRTVTKPIEEQKKDIQNIIHCEKFYKIKQLLNKVTYDKSAKECFIKLSYDGENIYNVLYNISR